jgi:hypothetical protein
MTEVDEMEIITEAVVALAHVLGAQIGIHGAREETAAIVKMSTPDQGKIAEIATKDVEQVEVQNERVPLR